MTSIVDSLRELASSAILSMVSRQTNESQADVARAFSAAIPATAATIASRCDDHEFVKQLADLATSTTVDADPLKGFGRIVTASTGIDTSTPSGSWLSSLFGNNLSTMVDNIASYAGIRGSSAGSILSVTAPLVLGYLGRLMRNENLHAFGLADRLRGARSQLAAAVPLGFEMPDFSRPSYRASRTAVDDRVRASAHHEPDRTAASWGIPLLALLGLLGLGGLIWWTGQRPATIENARVEVRQPERRMEIRRPDAKVEVREPDKTIGTTGVTTAAGKLTRALPGNLTVLIPVGSAEERLVNYLSSSGSPGPISIGFDRIRFETASAVLSSEAREQVDNIATILRAYPNASVRVDGFTDNTGNEAANLALSRARAEMIANRLTADGVGAGRVRIEGHGSQSPLADNATEGGRQENRRVQLEVSAK